MNRAGSKVWDSTAGIKSVRIAPAIRQISEKPLPMKKYLFLFLFILGFTFSSPAQSDEVAAVTEVVNRMFKAMYTNDTTLFKSAFAEKVTMARVLRNKEGKPVLQQNEGIGPFVKNIAKPNAKGALTEEMWNIKVEIDGDLAQFWCDYAFYIGNTFSHCGVDAFQLHKTADGWKIFHLADTFRRECKIPQNIQDKHK